MCKHIYNPETQYPKGTPFTYLISWSELNISYYGVRYKKTCHPDDLWNIYFTSSKPLKKFRKLNGEPDIVKVDFVYDTKEEARSSEYHYIKENNLVHNPQWLNIGNGGEYFCNLGGNKHSEVTKKKIGDANRLIPKKPHTEETKQKISDAHIGMVHSEETKKKLSEILKGKMHSEERKLQNSECHKGNIHINNGSKEKHIFPELLQYFLDLGWKIGSLPKSEEVKQKMSNSRKGKKQSPETIQKRLETKRLKRLENI